MRPIKNIYKIKNFLTLIKFYNSAGKKYFKKFTNVKFKIPKKIETWNNLCYSCTTELKTNGNVLLGKPDQVEIKQKCIPSKIA